MKLAFLKKLLLPAMVIPVAFAQGQVDHILLSEVGMNGAAGAEYVEIFNPLTTTVDLSNYWVTDRTGYENLPTDADGFFDLGTTDQIFRFAPGTQLPSGKVAIVVAKSTSFITAYFGGDLNNYLNQPGSPLLFEIEDTDPLVPNVVPHNNKAGSEFIFNLTNASTTNGEYVVMFQWDGVADLVKDVDMVAWGFAPGNSNAWSPKTSATLGLNGTPYKDDMGSHAGNLTLGVVQLATRVSITEASEVQTGGNGLTGHDESTEAVNTSWVGGTFATDMTPGTTALTVVGQNVTPLINSLDRNLDNPSSAQQITLIANATDSDGSISAVNFFVNTGSGFTSVAASNAGSGNWTATVGPFSDNTIVKFYVQATDNSSATVSYPPDAPTGFQTFIVDDTPIMPGDIVMNEVLYDTIGSDTDNYEFLELHNARSTPVDLSYMRFADANKAWYTIPEGTIIPPHGFIILTLNPTALTGNYPGIPGGTQIFDWGTFALNNSPEQLYLVAPNGFDHNSTITLTDFVAYTPDAPWPELNANATGRSMELINPLLDNELPESWKGSVAINQAATPGAENSVFSGATISNLTRSVEFPAASQTVTITVKAVGIGAPISTVKVFVDTGSGFAPVNMTLSATPDVYTANIGGFPANTVVKYYVEAANSAAQIGRLPAGAPASYRVFIVGSTAPASGSVVINEILYNNYGGDTYEYIELVNPTGSPIDLSYYILVDNQNEPYTIPAGTTIGANSYVILTQNDFAFRAAYGNPAPIPLLEWGTEFNLANTGDDISIIHPNQFNPDGVSIPVSHIQFTTLGPWPTWTGAPTDTVPGSPNQTGASIELINPLYSNRESGEAWAFTTNLVFEDVGITRVMGTPGAQNSVYQASVSDWSIY